MVAEEKAVVTITDEMAVEVPLPGSSIVEPFPINGRIVEQVASPAAIRDDSSTPPVGDRWAAIGGIQPLVSMRGKGIRVLICVELHEQPDLAQIVQARSPLTLCLGAIERRQEHRRENRNNRDDD